MPTDLKLAKRIRDTRLVANFSVRASSCAVCGAGRSAGLPAHHVLPRGRGGDDVTANLVALCGSGTTGCHGDVEEYRGEARRLLGLHLAERRPDTLEYLSEKLRHHGAGGVPEGELWRKEPRMEPYLRDTDATLYMGDCLDVLRELPDQSVRMCCTSPPFY